MVSARTGIMGDKSGQRDWFLDNQTRNMENLLMRRRKIWIGILIGALIVIGLGIGMFIKAGKGWYISSNWELGFNININYTNVTNEVETMTEKLSGFSIGLGFNATFN